MVVVGSGWAPLGTKLLPPPKRLQQAAIRDDRRRTEASLGGRGLSKVRQSTGPPRQLRRDRKLDREARDRSRCRRMALPCLAARRDKNPVAHLLLHRNL